MGGWVVGGWFLMHNHATSWSNLQDCKISSTAEIPKLDTPTLVPVGVLPILLGHPVKIRRGALCCESRLLKFQHKANMEM